MAGAEYPRWLERAVLDALADTPVVVVNGARQVGKSTLVRRLRYPGTAELLTLDDEPTRQAARLDPRAFVQRPVDTVVIDEAQLVPELFRAIKAEVDRDRRPGRFLLTGSSRLLAAPDMADSLVGRVEITELWPLAQDELARSRSSFLTLLFDAPDTLLRSGSTSREELVRRICVGGFPEAQARSSTRRAAWFDSYVTTTVERVVRQVADIERAAELPRLLRLCAARTGQELNVSSVASDFGVPARTVNGYLAHLSTAFLLQLTPAWSTNLSARVVRRPKLSIVDSGLAAHLMGVDESTVDRPGGALGPLLESFVTMEVIKLVSWHDRRLGVHHYRQRGGAEVDLVIEHPDGRVAGIEIKATSTPRPGDAAGLRHLAERLGERFVHGVLLTTAPEANRLGGRVSALPVEVLWR